MPECSNCRQEVNQLRLSDDAGPQWRDADLTCPHCGSVMGDAE